MSFICTQEMVASILKYRSECSSKYIVVGVVQGNNNLIIKDHNSNTFIEGNNVHSAITFISNTKD